MESLASKCAAKFAADATSLAEAGHFGRAAELFARAAQADPSCAKHHEARAQCLLELDKPEEAVAAAQAAVKANVSWLPGKATLARAHFNAGQLEDAANWFEKALSQAKGDGSEEWIGELTEELADAKKLLQRHQEDHHDILLPIGLGVHLRIRQALDCRYCLLSNFELGPGGAVWAAGGVLAFHSRTLVAEARGATKGPPRLLELGSGTGAAGLAAAAAGAEVVLTDHGNLLPLIQLNAGINSALISAAGGSTSSCSFDWESEPSEELKKLPFDLAIGADLVYSFAAVEPFATAMEAVLLPQKGASRPLAPAMIYAHFPRFPNLDQAMSKALKERGLSARERPMLPLDKVDMGTIPADALSRVRLLEITPGAVDAMEEPALENVEYGHGYPDAFGHGVDPTEPRAFRCALADCSCETDPWAGCLKIAASDGGIRGHVNP
mmetsp:Transcript_30610/g.70631  ORF Transcript_30610/g.70631 Transcript_30610/m.70631 type:complete len:440 (-) Transcript_30610:54-1373(-)